MTPYEQFIEKLAEFTGHQGWCSGGEGVKCPICGKDGSYTSVICLEHYPIIYDQDGNVISYADKYRR
jgi:hypothetical protein